MLIVTGILFSLLFLTVWLFGIIAAFSHEMDSSNNLSKAVASAIVVPPIVLYKILTKIPNFLSVKEEIKNLCSEWLKK